MEVVFMFRSNKKLIIDDILKSSLPAPLTCRGATEFCKSGCYGIRAYNTYASTAYNSHLANLAILQSDSFVDLAVVEIKAKNPQFFRINDIGDMPDQEAIDKWTEVIRLTSCHTRFYTYSKSLDLDFEHFKRWGGRLIQSVGGKFDHLIDYTQPHAVIIEKDEPVPEFYHDASESDLVAIYHEKIALRRKGKKPNGYLPD